MNETGHQLALIPQSQTVWDYLHSQLRKCVKDQPVVRELLFRVFNNYGVNANQEWMNLHRAERDGIEQYARATVLSVCYTEYQDFYPVVLEIFLT